MLKKPKNIENVKLKPTQFYFTMKFSYNVTNIEYFNSQVKHTEISQGSSSTSRKTTK